MNPKINPSSVPNQPTGKHTYKGMYDEARKAAAEINQANEISKISKDIEYNERKIKDLKASISKLRNSKDIMTVKAVGAMRAELKEKELIRSELNDDLQIAVNPEMKDAISKRKEIKRLVDEIKTIKKKIAEKRELQTGYIIKRDSIKNDNDNTKETDRLNVKIELVKAELSALENKYSNIKNRLMVEGDMDEEDVDKALFFDEFNDKITNKN